MSSTVEIVKTPDILHGQPRIEGTRLGVFMLGEMIRRGEWTAEEVIDEWDELTREHVEVVLEYYDGHPEEMDGPPSRTRHIAPRDRRVRA